ncbi:MAG: sugar phosphate isomerase/epimerase [Sphingobacteriales bacterium]|nr:sugar phosphate isomerase/epimerase [Sphingobacteriales bacterium]OJY92089.1 MAG: hypothetical protein BGP14_23700 [Sphingobacteriales bacterium 44-15]
MMNRRIFLKTGVTGLSVAPFTLQAKQKPLNPGSPLAIASFSMREFSLDDMLDICLRCGIKQIALKDLHLPLSSSKEVIEQSIKRCTEKGVATYAVGVVYMKTTAAIDQAFEYAGTAGVELMVAKPAKELLRYVEEKVKRYNIRIAIHNHGPGDQSYPSVQSAYELIVKMDRRMGLCMDIGHTKRIGRDPGQDLREFSDRIFDIHLKDVTAATAEGRNCIIGRGVIDFRSFLKAVRYTGYRGYLALEYEESPRDPLPGMMESLGYIKGMLAAL